MNKTVLVTGAAKGIGAAIVCELAKQGYHVCLNYHTSKEAATTLKETLYQQGFDVDCYQADISNRVEVDNMIDFVLQRFGSLDIVINNAGICEYKLFTDITNEDLNNMINTTIVGTFHVTQSALQKCMLAKKQGSIINISSVWGMVGSSFEVNYSTAKSAVIGMTKALAKELGPSHIRVNVVAPGAIDTDMMSELSSDTISQVVEEIPLGRLGTVEEIAKTVSFLASEESSYLTGQVISPNGGMVI